MIKKIFICVLIFICSSSLLATKSLVLARTSALCTSQTSGCEADLNDRLREKAEHTQKYVSIFPANDRSNIPTDGRSRTKSRKLQVILDWFPNPDHGPLILAEQKGFFKEQGLSVEIIAPADPTDPPKWVAMNKADIAVTYEPEFLEQVDRGLPLIHIGTLVDKPLNCLVALKENHIKNLVDLKGKRIGVTNSGLANIMLKVMLKKQGIKLEEVEIINLRYNLVQALLSHQVDAVTGIMRNVEVAELESKNKTVLTFFPEQNGIPTYSELIFIANKTHSTDDRFPRFMKAIQKATTYLNQHPQESWELFAKKYPETNNAINRKIWFNTLPHFSKSSTQTDYQAWENFAKFMYENRLIKKPFSRNNMYADN